MRARWMFPMLLALPRAAFAQDLTTTSVMVSPGIVELGTPLTVSGQFGGTYTGSVDYRVVLSPDNVLDPGDTTIHNASVMFNGSGAPFSTTFPMPVVPAATWTVFVEVDSTQMVAETDETNNARAAAQTLTMRGADLRIVSMTGPEYGFAGGSYRFDLTIGNTGQARATDFRYHIYYSDTPNIRVFSTLLGEFGPISIDAGAETTVSQVVTLPTTPETGYIGVIVDQLGQVPESSITNNIGRIQHEVRILAPSPELGARIIEVPAQAAIGEQLAVTRAIQNSGVAPATFTYAFYLSTDPTISTSDVEMGRFTGSIDAERDDYVIDLMNIPFGIVPGNYYVGLILDPEDLIAEPVETDNVILGPQISIFEPAIRFETERLPNGTVGVPYEVGVYATGPLPVTFSIGVDALPDGLSLEPAGIIRGTPTQNGRVEFTLRAHSGTAIADRRYSILVVETSVALEVVATALPTGVIGRTYQADLVAVGGQAPYTWSTASNLPPGLTLAPDGQISGTPEVEGDHPITVRVTDAIGSSTGRDFILRVITPDQSIEIVPVMLPDAIIGREYCDPTVIAFEAEKGFEPYTWSAPSDLPPGMTLSPAGELCGTPPRVGSFPFTVRVHDQTGLFDSALVVLDVLSESSFGIATITLPDAVVGQPYEAAIDVFGGEGPYTMTAIEGAGDLPPGLSLGEEKISGTPTAEGVFAFVVHVVDAANRSDLRPLSVAVRSAGELKETDGGCTAVHANRDASPLAILLLLGLGLLRGAKRRLSLLAVLLLAACGKEEVLPPEIVKFEVIGETSIRAGQSAMLSWETKNAASVQIVATPPGEPIPNVSGNSGTVMSPALFEPTTFQLFATGADGTRVSSSAIRVDVRGVRIQRFTATPSSIDPGQTSLLEWTIGGDAPTEVVLSDGMAELFSDANATGSFTVEPNKTTTYTLTVTAEAGTDEETVTVTVADVPPMIVSFVANPDPVAIGMLTNLRWETIGAFQVQVLKDGVPRRPWTTTGAREGSVSLEVDAPSVEFTLQARTETGMMSERTITVTGLEVPIIDQLELSPAEYTQASTVATVVWSTTHTDRTELQVNGARVTNFPGTPSGTHDFTVSGGTANVTLIARNDVGEARETRQILPGFVEPEPNDTATTAIALAGDGIPVRGTIASGDVDVYSVMVPEGARIEALVGWDGTSCSFDTVLELYDSDTTTRLGTVDDTDVPAIAPCSRINPAAHAWADDLAAGTYYLHVRSSTTAPETGTYSLWVTVSGPESPLPGVTQTQIGNPTWNIADVVQISILAGNFNTQPPLRFIDQTFLDLFLPLYTFEGAVGSDARVHPIFRPYVPNPRDYDGVLSALVAVAGYESKTTFTRAEFESDNVVMTLFVMVPGPGAPVESSFDFASGPVLPTELFPMTAVWTVMKDGMVWWEAPGFDIPGYHQLQPPVPGSGASHRIFGVLMFDVLGADPDPVGSYVQTFIIQDPQGNGWELTIPLTVTP